VTPAKPPPTMTILGRSLSSGIVGMFSPDL
jgi:hypothetical protein